MKKARPLHYFASEAMKQVLEVVYSSENVKRYSRIT